MVPRCLALLVVPLAACAAPQVVRDGPGWREVRVSEKETRFELTSPDPQAAAEIVRSHPDPALRAAALDRVSDPDVVARAARADADPGVRRRAVGRTVDRAVLAEVAGKDADPAIRALAAERRDLIRWVPARSPQHAGWASRAVGSWVRYRVELSQGTERRSITIQRTLAAVGPAGAVLEQRDVATGKALQGRVAELLDRAAAPVGRRTESLESVELKGRRTECPTALVSGQFGSVIARVKTWRADEVPGGLARIDVEESPEGFPLRSIHAVAADWGP